MTTIAIIITAKWIKNSATISKC